MDEFIKYGLYIVGLVVLYKLYNIFKVFAQRFDTMKKGAIEGIKKGAKTSLVRLNLEYMYKKLHKVAIEVWSGNNFESFIENPTISEDIKSDVILKTAGLRKSILKNDLFQYVQENYGVNVESVILEDK